MSIAIYSEKKNWLEDMLTVDDSVDLCCLEACLSMALGFIHVEKLSKTALHYLGHDAADTLSDSAAAFVAQVQHLQNQISCD